MIQREKKYTKKKVILIVFVQKETVVFRSDIT